RDATVTGVQTCALPISELGSQEGTIPLVRAICRQIGMGPISAASPDIGSGAGSTFVGFPIPRSMCAANRDGEAVMRRYAGVKARSEERRVGKECRVGGG